MTRQLPFADKSFDTIVCVEVLEHLERADALKAIGEFERIARRRVVVTVPRHHVDEHSPDERGFLRYEGTDPRVWEWVEAERHKSSFTVRDLQRIGFRCGRRSPGRPLLRLIGPFRRFYDNYASPSHAIMGVKDILSDGGETRPHGHLDREAPCETEGFADFRPNARKT